MRKNRKPVDKANQVLSDLPFEFKTNPGAWDFKPHAGINKVWKVFIIIALILLPILWLIGRLM